MKHRPLFADRFNRRGAALFATRLHSEISTARGNIYDLLRAWGNEQPFPPLPIDELRWLVENAGSANQIAMLAFADKLYAAELALLQAQMVLTNAKPEVLK